jgi:1-phosphofructokinase
MILIVGQNTAWQKVCFLPRLARGEVNRVREVHAFPSSKGPNVARALAGVGLQGLALGYVGGATGKLFSEGLRQEGLATHFTPIQGETRICTTYAEHDGPSTEVIEPSPEISSGERELFRSIFQQHIGEAQLLFICGTAVHGESEDCYAVMTAEAHKRGIPVLLDSSSFEARRALAQSPEILKVNMKELAEVAEGGVEELGDRVEAYRRLASAHGIRWFFTTHGPEGMEAFDGKTLLQAAPPRIVVVNTIGSGDAASAGIGWVILEWTSKGSGEEIFSSRSCLEQALVTATAMGTANCLNVINGRVEMADFKLMREKVAVREVPLP